MEIVILCDKLEKLMKGPISEKKRIEGVKIWNDMLKRVITTCMEEIRKVSSSEVMLSNQVQEANLSLTYFNAWYLMQQDSLLITFGVHTLTDSED